jgi:hypothetical protein
MRPALLAVMMWLGLLGKGQAAELTSADKDAIRELLVRHYLEDWQEPSLVFLVFDKDTDPPDAFIKRLADIKLRIRKGSKSKMVYSGKSASQAVFDKDTMEPGVLIGVSSLKLLGAGKAEVKGDVYRGPRCGVGGTFIVKKADGRWKISEEVSHYDI